MLILLRPLQVTLSPHQMRELGLLLGSRSNRGFRLLELKVQQFPLRILQPWLEALALFKLKLEKPLVKTT